MNAELCLSKRDNVSRCIYLHQILYIYVKIRLHISRFAYTKNKISIYESKFTYTYQDPLARTSSLINSDQLPLTRIDNEILYRSSRADIKIRLLHQDPHIYIKIYTSRL